MNISNNGDTPSTQGAGDAYHPQVSTAEVLVKDDPRTVRMGTLVSLIIGSTVGAGIFALPQNIASVASPGAALIGWAVTGVGMLCIAYVFQALALRKPHLDSGVYSYVRAGLGDFVGFASAWGYWLGTIIAQVGYATLFFSSLSFFFPIFGSDHPLMQSICVSALTWGIFLVLSRGVRQAAIMNVITTVAKILPILAFLVLVAFVGFNTDVFASDFWGRAATFGENQDQALSISDQVKGMMLFTVWAFIGVEGASTYSKRARHRKDVSLATFLGFVSVFFLLTAVSFLSFGVVSREELAAMGDNSMGTVLEHVVGPWGAGLISVGLCISVLGAYVSWQMLCAEPITLMAQDGLLPKAVGRTNDMGAPYVSQFLSALVIQAFIIVFYLNESTYTTMVQLATSLYLVPYVFSSLYLLFLATRGHGFKHPDAGSKFDISGPEVGKKTNRMHLLISVVAFGYSLWLLYAAELQFVLLGTLLIVPGLAVYVATRLKAGGRVFNNFEWIISAIVVASAIGALYLIVTGQVSL